jgi:hypothetical protein
MDRKPTRKPASQWHAVTIVLQTSSCAAAAMCRNTRYLSREAPRLPLSNCSNPGACPCKFKHHEDRRTGPRRGSDVGSGGDKPNTEKRRNRGRRAKDQR